MAHDFSDVAPTLGVLARYARQRIDAGVPVTPTRIIVFAKAPQPGAAKTRLIPALGVQGAAALAQHMLAETLRSALGAELGPVELCATPDPQSPAWRPIALP